MRVRRGRFRFELAGPEDDKELCRLLARVVMPGQVQITLRRDPSYFAAARIDGPLHQVVIARDMTDGSIAAMGSRSVRTRFVNGHRAPVGYLSNLRIQREYRGRTILARGYQYFKELDSDRATSFYLTTISATNEPALSALTARRAGLPTYHFVGRYHTAAIPLTKLRRAVFGGEEVRVRPANVEDRELLLEVYRTAARQYEFAPSYEAGDFFCESGTFIGLRPSDVLIATRAGRPVGMLGCWDQSSFRQTVVEGYESPLRYLRPWYNSWARLRGMPRLPRPGSPLRCLVAALPVVTDQDPGVMAALVNEVQRRQTAAVGQAMPDSPVKHNDLLLVGMFESDPLFAAVRPYAAFSYATNVYLVTWQDQLPRLGAAPLYLELGCL
jgi:hypothetical protein